MHLCNTTIVNYVNTKNGSLNLDIRQLLVEELNITIDKDWLRAIFAAHSTERCRLVGGTGFLFFLGSREALFALSDQGREFTVTS